MLRGAAADGEAEGLDEIDRKFSGRGPVRGASLPDLGLPEVGPGVAAAGGAVAGRSDTLRNVPPPCGTDVPSAPTVTGNASSRRPVEPILRIIARQEHLMSLRSVAGGARSSES
ncbi:MAG TPA: hypothetical protein DCQ98_20090 [Planctomycetaceae bacterium]|nr:hypothetical protein [Planctomycetaceae bacterium]